MPRARAIDEPGQAQDARAAHDQHVEAVALAHEGARARRGPSGTCRPAPGPRGRRARTRMPSSVSSAGQAGSPRRVTTVAGMPEAARRAPSDADVLLAAAEHGMERLGQEEDAGQRPRQRPARPRARARGCRLLRRRRSACPGSRGRCAPAARPAGRSSPGSRRSGRAARRGAAAAGPPIAVSWKSRM